jgi:hypothetical protein
MTWVYDDGGYANASSAFREHEKHAYEIAMEDGDVLRSSNCWGDGDCVARAISIASCLPYEEVWLDLRRRGAQPGFGVHWTIWEPYLKHLGFIHAPKCRWRDLPATGRLIVCVPRHLLAVIDGVAHDRFNSWRRGRIEGYWQQDWPRCDWGPFRGPPANDQGLRSIND